MNHATAASHQRDDTGCLFRVDEVLHSSVDLLEFCGIKSRLSRIAFHDQTGIATFGRDELVCRILSEN